MALSPSTKPSPVSVTVLFVSATLSENNVLYRCVITAANGDSLASDAARLTVPSSGTTYTTRFYLERIDGGYDLADQLVAAGE